MGRGGVINYGGEGVQGYEGKGLREYVSYRPCINILPFTSCNRCEQCHNGLGYNDSVEVNLHSRRPKYQ